MAHIESVFFRRPSWIRQPRRPCQFVGFPIDDGVLTFRGSSGDCRSHCMGCGMCNVDSRAVCPYAGPSLGFVGGRYTAVVKGCVVLYRPVRFCRNRRHSRNRCRSGDRSGNRSERRRRCARNQGRSRSWFWCFRGGQCERWHGGRLGRIGGCDSSGDGFALCSVSDSFSFWIQRLRWRLRRFGSISGVRLATVGDSGAAMVWSVAGVGSANRFRGGRTHDLINGRLILTTGRHSQDENEHQNGGDISGRKQWEPPSTSRIGLLVRVNRSRQRRSASRRGERRDASIHQPTCAVSTTSAPGRRACWR